MKKLLIACLLLAGPAFATGNEHWRGQDPGREDRLQADVNADRAEIAAAALSGDTTGLAQARWQLGVDLRHCGAACH